MHLPNELWLKIYENLSLQGLLASYCVNQLWRSLVPRIGESTCLTLFVSAMKDIEERLDVAQPISLPDRLACVTDTETTHNICIPEPLRMILTEWPSQRPPAGFCWPDLVVNHATGRRLCRYSVVFGESCQCETSVKAHDLDLKRSLRDKISRNELFDYHATDADSREELFSNPPRLHTDEKNEQTVRFIQMHPHHMWPDGSPGWTKLSIRCLVLYTSPRGEIHAWASGWYQGFEAKSFLELNDEGCVEEDEFEVNEEGDG